MKHILAILMLFSSLSGITIEIPLDKTDYHIEQVNEFDRILVDQPVVLPGAPGFPETPAYVCSYLIPKNEKVREIRILEQTWRIIPGSCRLYPKQQETSLETVSVFTPPDLGAYSSPTSFPVNPVIDFHCGNMRGFRILQITVCPFRYDPINQKLYVLENLVLDALTEYCPPGIAPRRTTNLSKVVFNDFLLNFVENKNAAKSTQYCPVIRVEDSPYDSLPTDLPSLLGPPVDLVIITDNAQFSAYESFAAFKKQAGINTVVKHMAWIRQYYSGVDDAERIRHFIKDAYDKWGTVFVLLGGDTPVVPTRFVWVDRTVIYSQLWLPISSDLYYSDLDGDWNFDGDERFGEVADSIDFYPEVFVGRIPTNSSVEVLDYLDKVKAYLFPTNTELQTKALFFSSNLDNNWPGLPYAYELSSRLPKHFTKAFLDETLNNLTLQTLADSIHAGFGIVTGIGHGDVNNLCIHFTPPRVYIDNFYFDSLTNSPLYGLMVVVTCYTNPFQSDCLGEHWVMNPNGGGMCYIGPTSSSEGSIHKEYMKLMFSHLFTGTISQALAIAKATFIGSAQINNWHRVHQFSISLLGDPTLALWNTNPRHFDSLIVQPGSLHVGYDTISINPGIVSSRVVDMVFYKPGETFVRGSASGGVLTVGVRTESAGYLKYAVMARGYIMYIDSVCVVPVEPCVVFSDCQVIDTLGNADGVVNPGEVVYLDLGLANRGGGLAESVYVELVCSDSLVQVSIDSAYYGDLGVGVTGYNMTPLCFDVSDSMPDEYSLDFEVSVGYVGGSNIDSFQLSGLASSLAHFGQLFSIFGDTLEVLPYLVNYGHSLSDSVYGVISGVSGGVLLDSVVNFPLVVAGGVVSSQPDYFRLVVDSVGCAVSYQYRVYEGGVGVIDHAVVLGQPLAVCSLRILGRREAVSLEWLPEGSASGYRVYRGLSMGGPYSLLSSYLGVVSYYQDYTVQPGISYYYYVVAYDSSMNISIPSDTVCGKTNNMYAPGWPQTVYAASYSSPNFGDIDPFYPGLEIVVCGDDGYVYAWHYDGSPVSGSDGRFFNANAGKIWSSPAIGDVDGDGHYEIAFGVPRNSDNLYIIRYNPFYDQAIVLPGWPKSIGGSGLVSSPVLADIDEDGDLEVFAVTFSPANIYAFHHDGHPVYEDTSGLLDSLSGILRGTPAIGDLNCDGDLEIVCCGGSESTRLYVWDRYGNYLPPFPVQVEPDQEYSVVLGDIVGDENLEICFYTGNPSNKLNLVDHNGNILWQKSVLAGYIDLCPAFGDMDNDGTVEVIFGYNDGLDFGIAVFDSAGNYLPGFPTRGHDAYPPIIVDANGDDVFEALCGSTEWQVHAYDGIGHWIPGFPIKLGSRINSSPAGYDIDGDGKLELMVSCYDFKFHVFDLDGSLFDWPRFHYDPHNSGWYKSGYYTAIHENMSMDNITHFGLEVYPNPFKKALDIRWTIEDGGCKAHDLSLKIYDVTGRLVKDFDLLSSINYLTSPIIWSGTDSQGRYVPSGVYFVKFEHNQQSRIEKIVKIQ